MPDADWAALASGLDGRVLRPETLEYEQARTLANRRFDAVRPAAIAQCLHAGDVAECIAYASRQGLRLAIRGGGHSHAGYSTGPGLVIDTRLMRTVTVEEATVSIGAGALGSEVAPVLSEAGCALPVGGCSSVGLVGLALGGGLGPCSRAWGLTCDAVAEADVVTAEGRTLTCSARAGDPHRDLFWVLCGGGSFGGVVTSMRMSTVPTAGITATAYEAHWSFRGAAEMLRGWQQWLLESAPDETGSLLTLGTQEGKSSVGVRGVHLGDANAAHSMLDRLEAAVGLAAASRSVVACTQPWDALHRLEEGLTATPQESADLGCVAVKSHILHAPMTGAAMADLVSAVVALEQSAAAGSISFDALGGAIARRSPDATAFPHRRALAVVQYTCQWAPLADDVDIHRERAWLRATHARMQQHLGVGAYLNYPDDDLPHNAYDYLMHNHGRLGRVAARYGALT